MSSPRENVTRQGPYGLTERAQAVLRGLGDVLAARSERARIQRDALIALLVRVASAGVLYLVQIVLARWMGGFEYGLYVYVWTWVLVLGGLSNLGLSTAVIRLLPAYRETGDRALLAGLLNFVRLAPLALSTVTMLGGLLVLHLAGDAVASPYVLPAFLALACVPVVTLCDIQDGVGRGGGWMAAGLLPPYVLRPLLVLVGMTIAHAAGWPMSAMTAAGAAVIASWVAALVQTLLLQRRLKALTGGVAARYAPGQWLAISLPLLAISGCDLIMQNADVLIMSRYLQPTDVAIYFAATKTMSLVMFVHYAVGSAVANRFAALGARGDQAALKAFAREAVAWTFWPSVGAAGLLLLLGKPLLWLFGPQFTAGYPVMLIAAVGFLARAAMGPSDFLLNMLGEQKACAVMSLSMALASVLLNLFAIPHFGMLGAALTSALVLGGGAVAASIVVRRRLGFDVAIWNGL